MGSREEKNLKVILCVSYIANDVDNDDICELKLLQHDIS